MITLISINTLFYLTIRHRFLIFVEFYISGYSNTHSTKTYEYLIWLSESRDTFVWFTTIIVCSRIQCYFISFSRRNVLFINTHNLITLPNKLLYRNKHLTILMQLAKMLHNYSCIVWENKQTTHRRIWAGDKAYRLTRNIFC